MRSPAVVVLTYPVIVEMAACHPPNGHEDELRAPAIGDHR